MMNVLQFYILTVVGITLFLGACKQGEEARVKHGGALEFAPIYNAEIKEWLSKELTVNRSMLVQAEGKLNKFPEDSKLKSKIVGLKRTVAKYEYRIERGDYFQIKTLQDLPQNLEWTSGEVQPEVGDPNAQKGGVFNNFVTSFPATLRYFGPEANSGFRGLIYDNIEIPMVLSHPVTQESVPGVAEKWAFSKDKKTVFYKIDAQAKFSDGVKVKALDVFTYAYVRISPFVNTPYWKQYFREQIAGITVYGEAIVALSLPEQKPRMEQFSIPPAPTHFYRDYGPDFTKFYQWKVQPTTGAYYVDPKDVIKGTSVTMTRNKQWWAKDKKYLQNRFNPDKVKFQIIGDYNKAFELFRAGKIDYFDITSPRFWFEKSEIAPVFKGYIERRKFYNQYPRIPWGLYLNVSKPILKNLNVRLGIQHAMNFGKVNDIVFRGEYSRLKSFSQGYGTFSNPDLKAREYSIVKAREYFAMAGYTEIGKDGILRKPDGSKLTVSITFANSSGRKQIMSKLKEFAIKAGLEIRIDALERTVCFQKVAKKQHEMVYTAWNVSLPYPRFYQFFHSSNAYDEKGNPKPATNNINSYASSAMDRFSEAMRNARTEQEIIDNTIPAQRLIWDEALFVPGHATEYFCTASWRWICWPDTDTFKISTPLSADPMEDYLFWIDSNKKEETLRARSLGNVFPEIQEVNDTFKNGIPEKYLKP